MSGNDRRKKSRKPVLSGNCNAVKFQFQFRFFFKGLRSCVWLLIPGLSCQKVLNILLTEKWFVEIPKPWIPHSTDQNYLDSLHGARGLISMCNQTLFVKRFFIFFYRFLVTLLCKSYCLIYVCVYLRVVLSSDPAFNKWLCIYTPHISLYGYQSVTDLTHPTHAYMREEQKARPQHRELRALIFAYSVWVF